MVSHTSTSRTAARRCAFGLILSLSALFTLSSCGAGAEDAPQPETSTVEAESPASQAVWPEGEEPGTLANPYSIGEEINDGDWSLTIDSVDLDANAEFAAMDSFVSVVEPDPGNTWVMITATWTYNGSEPAEGGTQFSIVNEEWTDVDDRDNEYGTTFNSVSTLTDDDVDAPPAEKGFTITDTAILQMPVEHASTSSMVTASFNAAGFNRFLIELT